MFKDSLSGVMIVAAGRERALQDAEPLEGDGVSLLDISSYKSPQEKRCSGVDVVPRLKHTALGESV